MSVALCVWPLQKVSAATLVAAAVNSHKTLFFHTVIEVPCHVGTVSLSSRVVPEYCQGQKTFRLSWWET